MPAARSYLYVPGDKPEVLAKALGRGADALIVDLEDAVAPAAKDQAREVVRRFLADLPAADRGDVQIWVRVNGEGRAGHDIEAVAAPAVTGFCLAKTESVDDVDAAAEACGRAEEAAGLSPGTFALAPLLESAAAVLDARAIASASPRVARLQVGEADLRADIGVTLGADERELLLVRSSIVLASAAAGIEPPVGPVSTNFRDLAVLRASTEALAQARVRGSRVHPPVPGRGRQRRLHALRRRALRGAVSGRELRRGAGGRPGRVRRRQRAHGRSRRHPSGPPHLGAGPVTRGWR